MAVHEQSIRKHRGSALNRYDRSIKRKVVFKLKRIGLRVARLNLKNPFKKTLKLFYNSKKKKNRVSGLLQSSGNMVWTSRA